MERGNGFRVSPWGGAPFDSVWKLRLNEKLEMRNAKYEMVVRRQILRLSSHCFAFT